MDEKDIRFKVPNLEDMILNGLVVSEEVARSTPCTCYEYEIHGKTKRLCWSAGVVGTLTDEQERLYCNPPIVKKDGKGIRERIKKIGQISSKCKKGKVFATKSGKIKVIKDLSDRLECLRVELQRAGIELSR